jgi:hypothetical protein
MASGREMALEREEIHRRLNSNGDVVCIAVEGVSGVEWRIDTTYSPGVLVLWEKR